MEIHWVQFSASFFSGIGKFYPPVIAFVVLIIVDVVAVIVVLVYPVVVARVVVVGRAQSYITVVAVNSCSVVAAARLRFEGCAILVIS